MCETIHYSELPITGQRLSPLPGVAALTSLPADDTDSWPDLPRSPTARRKLWEIPHKHHCTVIGTCLHVDELRRVAQKIGRRPLHRLSDYEVHVSFVSAASERNALSLALQRLLERKYAAAVKRFARVKSADDLERLWDEALAEGQVQGALWAVMTHPRAEADMCALAYADVHMLSHQIGAGPSADLRALAETRGTLARMRRDNVAERERTARKIAERDARIEQLERQLRDRVGVEQALATAREQIARLESDAELDALRDRLQSLMDRLRAAEHHAAVAGSAAEQQRRRAAIAEQRNADLGAELAERKKDSRALERVLSPPDDERCGCDGDCARCTNPTAIDGIDLHGRRILCVGGRGSLNRYYRDLVQRCNGELIRHDGGLEDSRQRLEALLSSADAVVCPADCVSHDAYQRTKRYCKRTDTPCVLLDRSGIGAFAKALSQLGGCPTESSVQA